MAEILVANQTNPNPGGYERGDVVVIMPDGHVWGRREGLPSFVIVKVPGLAVGTIADRVSEWRADLSFSVLNHDAATDTFDVRAVNQTMSSGGANGITREQVERYLGRWRATVLSLSANQVDFRVAVWDAIQSVGMWADPNVTFTRDSYDPASGNYTVTAEYPASPKADRTARAAIERRGGVVIVAANGTATFGITRDAVRSAFLADVRYRVGSVILRRRVWYFPANRVDNAVSQGGVVTITANQLQTFARSRLEE